MPPRLIEGTFHVVGKQPDGDTFGFKANNINHWKKLSGRRADLDAQNMASLRLEAIGARGAHTYWN